MSRTLAIGDVHGCLTALETVLDAAGYDNDQLIFMGDLVDRGPRSKELIDFVLAQPDARSLKGNHELMMLAARSSVQQMAYWMVCGGRETIESYGPVNENWVSRVPDKHWDFLEGLPDYIETDDVIYVHATPDPDFPIEMQDEFHLQWKKCGDFYPEHESGKLILSGHSSQKNGEILDLDTFICIDTFAYGGQWLTCLDMESGQWWQANQDAETRSGRLPKNELQARQNWG